jgi:hypothetical protein
VNAGGDGLLDGRKWVAVYSVEREVDLVVLLPVTFCQVQAASRKISGDCESMDSGVMIRVG